MNSIHWHVYIDETGKFEKAGGKKGIFALLVRDNARENLGQSYQTIVQKIMDSEHIHLMEHWDNPQTDILLDKLIDETLHFAAKGEIVLGYMDYKGTAYPSVEGTGSEMYAGNRYLYMLQHMLEHIFFLYPGFWGQDLKFSLHPCNRVFPADPKHQKDYDRLGLYSFTPPNCDRPLVHVWNKEALRVFTNRLGLDYSAGLDKTGARDWVEFELPIARRSQDPLVHMVDNLAGTLLWSKKDFVKTLRNGLNFDLQYGHQEVLYQDMARSYLFGDHHRLIMEVPEKHAAFNKEYYKKCLSVILENCFQDIHALTKEAIWSLERYIDQCLRDAKGNWSFLQSLNNRLLEGLSKINQSKEDSEQTNLLLNRLLGHSLSIHNHRGETSQAIKAWKSLQKNQPGSINFDFWREIAAISNRAAVIKANLFDFAHSSADIIPLKETLEKCVAAASAHSGQIVKDDLISKINGTMAQNLAFEASWKPEYFPLAESIFLQAMEQFDRAKDKKRQNNYLMHLYLDWQSIDPSIQTKLKNTWLKFLEDEATKDFLCSPNAENSRYMQFDLALALKYIFTEEEYGNLVDTYTLDNLEHWFGDTTREHPFQFITAYLGRMAMRQDRQNTASSLFTRALEIPGNTNPLHQPTLQAIRAQIMGWWAMELNFAGSTDKAADKFRQAVDIMEKIGREPGLETILALNKDEAVSGWFAPAWRSIYASARQNMFSHTACKHFLDCFTFNYR